MSYRYSATAITLIYAAFAAVWIVASGAAVYIVTTDVVLQGRIEVFKGLAFVGMTSGLLFFLLQARRDNVSASPSLQLVESPSQERGQLLLVLAILILIAPMIGFSVYVFNARQVEQEVFADLKEVAEMKVGYLEDWLTERQRDSEILAANSGFIQQIMAIQRDSDALAIEAVRNRLSLMLTPFAFNEFVLLDASGQVLPGMGGTAVTDDIAQGLIRDAVSSEEVQISDLYRDPTGVLRIGFAVPLISSSLVGIVLLYINPETYLFPTLQTWPLAGYSGETLLVRREGNSVLFLNELRHRQGTALTLRLPVDSADLPAAAALREASPGAIAGMDYRGEHVLSVWRPVNVTGWSLVAKLDYHEALAPARNVAMWATLIAFLGASMVAVAVLLLFRDQRRLRQLALTVQSDQLLTQFYELPFVGMAITSAETKHWLKFNDHLCTLFGYKREEMIRSNWLDLTHPEDRDKDLAEFERVLRGQSEGYVMDKRFIRKDGSVLYASIDVKCVRKMNGTVDYFVATIEDLTERRTAYLKLQQSEEKLRQILEHSTQAYYSHTVDNRFLYVSPQLPRLVDWPADDMPSYWTELLTDNPINAAGLEATRKAIETGEAQPPYQLQLKSRMGRLVWVEIYESPVVVQGKTTTIVGALSDITERKDMEMKRYAEEERLRLQRKALLAFAGSESLGVNLTESIRQITEIDAKTMAVARVSVWLYAEDHSALRCVNLYDQTQERHTTAIELSAADYPDYFHALATQDLIFTSDAHEDPRTCELTERYLRPAAISSMLDVPIYLGTSVTGILCHEHVGPQRQWTSDEKSFAVAVANLVSLALAREDSKIAAEANRQTLQRLNEAQRIGHIGDWEYDIATQSITWSTEVYEIMGRDPQLGPPQSLEELAALYTEESRIILAEKIQQAIASGESQEYELILQRHGERQIVLNAVAVPNKDEHGKVTGLYGTIQDISTRKRQEQVLHMRAEQQLIISKLGRFALNEADIDMVFTEAASATAFGLGVEYSKVLMFKADEDAFVLKAGIGWRPEWQDRIIAIMATDSRLAAVMSTGQAVIINDFAVQSNNSTTEILAAHGISSGVDVAISGSKGPYGVLGVYAREPHKFDKDSIEFVQSIANILSSAIDRKQAEAQLLHMAHFDALTDLPNRVLLKDRLAVAIAQAQRTNRQLAVLFLDLDRFKTVNDSFGHDLGDNLLREVARRLSHSVRASDTVCRQGGDEFLIVLPDIETVQDAARVAEKLLASLTAPIAIGDLELLISASIGIACYPDNGKDVEALLRNADAAMYVAKDLGHNLYQYYSEEMNYRARERLILESDLRRAVERNELFLQYQPQIAFGSQSVIGVEALVRWRHPVRGIIPPIDFITIAEESGLINAIGDWVLETACRQQAVWVSLGIAGGPVAVNVSSPQFRQPEYVSNVLQILNKTGLAPQQLELELTESVVMHGVDIVRDKLNKLDSLGVRLAIDDFGTGYSSLSYLNQFPIHRLKIDKSFISGLPDDREGGAIAQAIISMGHSLSMTVIAEGIETEAQAEYLQSLWCDDAQGYLYSRPLLPEDCTAFLLKHRQLKNMPDTEGE